jgi:pimeloyl-ACP methyl ester carboxylesterase
MFAFAVAWCFAVASGDLCTAQETWVGWLETKSQNLRLIVQLNSKVASKSDVSGSISSPDQSPASLPITKASIDEKGAFTFEVNPQGIGSAAYGFKGEFQGESLIGELEQAGVKIPITFAKTKELPSEGKELLGANSAWVGSLDVGSRKVPLRFRIYNSAPYATAEAPRVLFDSLLEKANGFPASLSVTKNGEYEFSIPAIPGKAKYVATVSADGAKLTGKFQQGFLPLSLEMTRVDELADSAISEDAMLVTLNRIAKNPKGESSGAGTQDLTNLAESSNDSKTSDQGQNTQRKANVTPAPPQPGLASLPKGIREESFVVERFDAGKPRLDAKGKKADNRFELAGTVTYPAGFSEDSLAPAVVLITGSGPQDRDETIGRHKPFLEIARSLASLGMVVFRYDDRGVGQSTGDFVKSTTNDFAEDAVAVWQYARAVPGIDRSRVGLLGHSEGGIIGPMVAAWQREVAFMVLLAPPGLSGGQVLSSQIDRIAELQGVPEAQRAVARSLQLDLQRIALKYDDNDEAALSEVRKAVVERWEGLNQFSANAAGGFDDLAMKKQVIDQISAQFRGLQSAWMRHFLAYDPSSNWVLFDSPVLAIWGERDTQVLPEINREKLEEIAMHNTSLQSDFVVMPGLNHLLQSCNTGLPDEYDSNAEAISPLALEVIGNWLKEREILP